MPALIIIDMQKAVEDPSWTRYGPRNNPGAEEAGIALLEAWRAAGRPIYHVRHDSVEPQSTYRPGQPGNEFKDGFSPREGETLIVKSTGSAFIRTPLEKMLRDRGESTLIFAGVSTNHCIDANVRNASDLGFTVFVAEDACFTFAKPDWTGTVRTAEEVHAMTLGNLQGEYCQVVNSRELITAIRS